MGVVDVIFVEDMGKFFDINLVELLQCIIGVLINCVNGEGLEVIVCGFGGNFNLIILNGCQMLVVNVVLIIGNLFDQGVLGIMCLFDFFNLVFEGVSGIEVYKIGCVVVLFGGIGVIININMLKLLVQGNDCVFIGVKVMKDESGDGVILELSGVVNWVNDDGNFGVVLFGLFQECDFGSCYMSVENYQLYNWDLNFLGIFGLVDGVNVINVLEEGQLVVMFLNLGIGLNEDNCECVNGMLIVQYVFNDNMIIMVDVIYVSNIILLIFIVDGIWFVCQFIDMEFDGNLVVVIFICFIEDIDGGKDFFF